MNTKALLPMLKKTEEWKLNEKSIAWLNKYLPNMGEAEAQAALKRFEDKVDAPLNEKWQQILRLYKVIK
jgi:hypothetical protein